VEGNKGQAITIDSSIFAAHD